MHKTIAIITIILFLLIATSRPMPAQAGDGEPAKVEVVPTEYGAELHTESFQFVAQPINAICFADYCYMVVKRGDPTPQPN